MKKVFLLSLLLSAAGTMLTSCIGDEPANAECDIEKAWVHVSNPRSVFYNDYDSLITVSSTESEIHFETRGEAIHEAPIFFLTTPGASLFIIGQNGSEAPFQNGSSIDFSSSKIITFRVRSEDRHYHRDYTVQVVPRPEMPVNPTFDFDNNFELATIQDNDPYPFYVWTETDVKIKWWASGNPGFRLSGQKAKAMESSIDPPGTIYYPTSPELETGVDGKNCLKLTTRDTGSLGKMVSMPIAAGNLFSGSFDTGKAMTETLAATRMGQPYAHKPIQMTGYYKFKPGPKMQDRNGYAIDGETDYPDIYCIVYRNTDDNNNPIQLDGNLLSDDIKVNPHKDMIVGKGRIKPEDIDISGSQWKPFSIQIAYTQDISEDDVLDYKYSTAVVFSSSVRGAEFIGAPGSTLWIDNVKLECEY